MQDCERGMFFLTRGQWPFRLASYGDELMISDSKLDLKYESEA